MMRWFLVCLFVAMFGEGQIDNFEEILDTKLSSYLSSVYVVPFFLRSINLTLTTPHPHPNPSLRPPTEPTNSGAPTPQPSTPASTCADTPDTPCVSPNGRSGSEASKIGCRNS